MAPPPIQLFLTTIASQPALRQRQEYILRSLQVKKIPFTSYDLASDEDAKRLWKRKAPRDNQQLPGILVGGKWPGTFTQFEEAVEFNELEIFLRQNEEWKAPEDERPALVAKPVGVPGAYEPLQMFPKHAPSRSPSPNPQSLREKEKRELDVTDQLGEFGLEGVSVSADDLRALVEELGLGGDDANDLVKGLAGDVPSTLSKGNKTEGKPLVPKTEEKKEDVKPAPVIKVQTEGAPDTKAPDAEKDKPQAVDVKEQTTEKVTEKAKEQTTEKVTEKAKEQTTEKVTEKTTEKTTEKENSA